MGKKLTEEDARQSMSAHMAAKGEEIRELYGEITYDVLLKILEDRTVCRYPVEIMFQAEQLGEGEFAFPAPKGDSPEDGFVMFVHPHFQATPERIPALVLYQLAAVNYGDFASPDDAEIFGAEALGMAKEDYYQLLCEMADELDTQE